MSRIGSWGLVSSEERVYNIVRSALVAGLAAVPTIMIPYYPVEILIFICVIEFLVAYRSKEASLSLGLALSLPAALYQKQIFGTYYLLFILIPTWTIIIFLHAYENGWVASSLFYAAILLGWSSLSSPLSFLPPALLSVLFTPNMGLLTGAFTGLSTILLAYAHGANSYGFVNLPASTASFIDFQKPALARFGPVSLIEPIAGLAAFDNSGFVAAMFPLVEILTGSLYVYIQLVTWSLACYLPGKIAPQWKISHPYSLGLAISPITMLLGHLLTGGLANVTAELVFLGVLVPFCLAGGIAISGLEGAAGGEGGGPRWSLGRLFGRKPKAEIEEAEEEAEEEALVEVPVKREEEMEAPAEMAPEPAPRAEPMLPPTPDTLPRVNDLIQLEEAFTKNLGLGREEIFGRKILFDYDPVSEYEKAVRDFCIQGLANRGLVMVFTRKGSPIYNALYERAAIRFYCLTSQVSVPTEAARNEIWLPANDVSLMLDALNKTILSNPRASIWVVYDNLTELIFATGFEKTYGFLRYATEILSLDRVAALFLLNSKAHDDKISISIKGLFRNHVSCGTEGLKLVRFPRAGVS
ncbi:MAG: hypothetical protein JTT11_04970 [Candidatus Brockarchaeota archaeon]|nr:hypothetical protein [Candidatus Brockarchaeota archaeon]